MEVRPVGGKYKLSSKSYRVLSTWIIALISIIDDKIPLDLINKNILQNNSNSIQLQNNILHLQHQNLFPSSNWKT